MRRFPWSMCLALAIASACGDVTPASTPTPAVTAPADYTVLREEMRVEGDRTGERRSYTITYALAGSERTIEAAQDCYESAVPQTVIAIACRTANVSSSPLPFVMPSPAPTVPASCNVTRPVAPDAVPAAAAEPIVSGSSRPAEVRRSLTMFGNDAIWVVLPVDGVVTLWTKFPTVRLIEGVMTASARRVDSGAPPFEVPVIAGYGETGFQAFAINFPEPGCCEVTQRVAGKELRFTVWVVG